ncbi:MAG TPA: branched-chain amino acid transaminase [Candidatus Angelobacter sp.]|nr:branched-chain amino acid transaminase [Candidatus Angelobacter sp.]
MGFESTQWVWMNGRFVAWEHATVHASSHALHYGSGVFEGIRCYETADGPAVFRLEAHLDRLYESATAYRMQIPYSKERLAEAVCETITRNAFTDCYVRPICYRGSSSLGVHPQNCPVETAILTWPWGKYLGEESLEKGVRITVSPWRKFHSQMMPTAAKACGQYLNSILAVQDATERGFDEALLLNADGSIAEGSGENIFIVRDGALITNGPQDSILLGITRDCVLQFARDLGWKVETRSLSLDCLLESDEAFFTGTAAEVVPICEVDGRQIGTGKRGSKTKVIQDMFSGAASGRDQRYHAWLYSIETRKRAYASS